MDFKSLELADVGLYSLSSLGNRSPKALNHKATARGLSERYDKVSQYIVILNTKHPSTGHRPLVKTFKTSQGFLRRQSGEALAN